MGAGKASRMFCCQPSRAEYARAAPLAAPHTVFVTPAFGEYGGDAQVFCAGESRFQWRRHGGAQDALADESGARVSRLQPGRYTLSVDDHEQGIEFEVRPSAMPTVTGYAVAPASGEYSRDGAITAKMNVPDNTDMLVAWSNGCFTTTKTLADVKPGVYVATLLQISGQVVPCVHACAAATVHVRVEE